jgi:hypothetical protein
VLSAMMAIKLFTRKSINTFHKATLGERMLSRVKYSLSVAYHILYNMVNC